MRLIYKDISKVTLLILLIYSGFYLLKANNSSPIYLQIMQNIPYFLVISLLFYALIKVFISILFINDCDDAYLNLIKEIKEVEDNILKLGLK